MATLPEFYCGQELSAEYPFVRTTYDDMSECDADNGPVEKPTWKPGVNFESNGFDGTDACADAKGQVVYTVIAVFKPGSYPERVFYTRAWIDPDGKRFGKGNLRMTTKQNFRVMLRGYRHDYELYEE